MTGDKNKEQDKNSKGEITKGADTHPQTPTSVNETKSDGPKAQSSSEKKPAKKKGGSFIIWLVLFIVLAALAVGGYFAWQLWTQYTTAQEQRIQALESATAEQSSEVQTLSSQQNEQSQDQSELLNSIKASQEAIQQRLDSHTQRIRALAGTSRDDWLLAEARYLLRLANQRLLVERGTDGARALLESADTILLSVDDDSVMPVRSAIANEVIALKLAETIDRQGLYLRLSAIKQQIQALPLIPFRPDNEEPSTSPTGSLQTPESDRTWYDPVWNSIKSVFGNLDRFIQIRDHDQAPELLISETQQLQTINHLMLMFEQAQFALLHEEEMIYRNSLEEAINGWTNYYSHYNEYEVLRNEMRDLQTANIIQVLPNISRSSELLTDYIERFHKLNTATTPSVPNDIGNETPEKIEAETKPEIAPATEPVTNETLIQEPKS